MSDHKISINQAIDGAMQLDGDPAKVKAYYEDWARDYNFDTASAGYSGPGIATELLKRHLGRPNALLLDAGCGTGLVGAELRAAGYQNFDGFDLSDAMAALAIAGGHYRQVQAGVDIMCALETYPEAAYDAVLAVGVFTLGHVPPAALSVLLRLAQKDAVLIVSTRRQYYEQTDFQCVVDALIDSRQMKLLQLLENAPYNIDGDGHYWVFCKSG